MVFGGERWECLEIGADPLPSWATPTINLSLAPYTAPAPPVCRPGDTRAAVPGGREGTGAAMGAPPSLGIYGVETVVGAAEKRQQCWPGSP